MRCRLLDTALGPMAIGWTDAGISRVLLPGDTPQAMRARLERAGGVDDPEGQPEVAARILAYAQGAQDNFADLMLDLSGVPEVNRRVYGHIRELAWGETTTYGAIARWLGDVVLSRAVGAAMGANPIPLIVPCHRVLAADGRTGGFSSPGGVRAKMEMLALERAASPTGQFSFGF
ncbi:MAG: methylated-DNA--[protein]-cysteine S-methyltransferase [Devosia sp.]|uniref:methylated-DNA--[protein]-cysteine S-methyltransferase n=1 Tax=Devosia sp. TaxID=1871048 RepID=UPI00262298D9|nr:methylated-DNA--[protein]-cysteine S-methyltransferase [Devosia sp.]MDB5542204.1 methylated-DNA--[protein]-cysteine S-methyltransferase [Devosia sp.]